MPGEALDSFALIAYFRDEAEAETAQNMLVTAGKKDAPLHMTEVNYAEVKHSIVKKDGADAWDEAAKILQALPIEFHPATRELADVAFGYKARFKPSLAEAFATALAKEKSPNSSPEPPNSRPWRTKSKSGG